jgi:hypothetical protein
MSYRLALADLANMSKPEVDRALGELVSAAKAPRNGQRAELDARIHHLELQYEMTSDEMRESLRNGRIKETAEIAHWLFLIRARETGAVK